MHFASQDIPYVVKGHLPPKGDEVMITGPDGFPVPFEPIHNTFSFSPKSFHPILQALSHTTAHSTS